MRDNTLDGMYTTLDKAEQILSMLVEGCSINTIERVTGVHHGTILKVLVTIGEKCEKLMGRLIVNVPVKDVQCDEI
jgi:transposase-like protein